MGIESAERSKKMVHTFTRLESIINRFMIEYQVGMPDLFSTVVYTDFLTFHIRYFIEDEVSKFDDC